MESPSWFSDVRPELHVPVYDEWGMWAAASEAFLSWVSLPEAQLSESHPSHRLARGRLDDLDDVTRQLQQNFEERKGEVPVAWIGIGCAH